MVNVEGCKVIPTFPLAVVEAAAEADAAASQSAKLP
jgi:hypothetical protein